MKLLAIIVDADGALHIEATRAPDLRRREISNLTGTGRTRFLRRAANGILGRSDYARADLASGGA